MTPILGITMGDPAGVGPELLLRVGPRLARLQKCRFVIFGDFDYLVRAHSYFHRKKIASHFPFKRMSVSDFFEKGQSIRGSRIAVIDSGILTKRPLTFGRVTRWGGEASGLFIAQAVQSALQKKISAIVTLPINKQSFSHSLWGKKFVDHTGTLAALTGSKSVALMLAAGNLRAVHVTQHLPLRQVSPWITTARVGETIRLTREALKEMGIASPKIAVCGLNPHAGDGGVLGYEERREIAPAVRRARLKGWKVVGPLSADTVWPQVISGTYDAGVAMYHDQGQIPVKLFGERVVNVTLGLPFVRTSVGHGTAFEIAGKGCASATSFLCAIETALSMVKKR